MPNQPELNAWYVSIAARLIRPEMRQSDYTQLRRVAEILNPDKRGYVKILNDDVRKVAPHIEITD